MARGGGTSGEGPAMSAGEGRGRARGLGSKNIREHSDRQCALAAGAVVPELVPKQMCAALPLVAACFWRIAPAAQPRSRASETFKSSASKRRAAELQVRARHCTRCTRMIATRTQNHFGKARPRPRTKKRSARQRRPTSTLYAGSPQILQLLSALRALLQVTGLECLSQKWGGRRRDARGLLALGVSLCVQ